jgi:hypothetical protein
VSFSLTGNFLANARAVTFEDGGGISWSFNKNSNQITATGSGGGVLSSVGLADDSTAPIYAIGSSPLTANGTLTITLNTQTANKVFAGPTTGSAAQPGFRLLAAADMPTGIPIANLTYDSVTVTAGTGLSGGGAVTLGGSVTLSNAGVTSLAGTVNQITVSGSTGAVTLSLPQNINSGASPTFSGANFSAIPNGALTNSAVTVTAGSGMSGGGSVSLGGSVTLTNAGVTSAVAGTGITVSGATGAVTITNSGVTSAVAGTGVTVSGATGAVTFSIGQAVAASSSPTFAALALTAPLTGANGGTGVNNGTSTITIGGNVTFSGAHTFTGTLTANTSVTFPTSGTLATTSQIPASANPSASVGLSAVDGTASTFMTSDSAPALSQAITPTWTGNHNFKSSSGVNVTITYNGGTDMLDLNGSTGTVQFNGAGTQIVFTYNGYNYIAATGGSSTLQIQANSLALVTNGSNAILINSSQAVTVEQALGVHGNSPPAQSTGWGTPTGGSVQNNFAGGSASLTTCTAAVAQIISVLKAVGFLGT